MTHPDAQGKDVTSFLIQPVQRVLRYRLLLADLLKHTPADDPDAWSDAAARSSASGSCSTTCPSSIASTSSS